MPESRKTYTADFKLEAIRLAQRPDTSIPKTAEALGIHNQLLYSWIREHKNQGEGKVFPGKGVVSRDEELHKLRQELKRVTEERDFLKKTAAFFARESK